jgi:hypothetical protein
VTSHISALSRRKQRRTSVDHANERYPRPSLGRWQLDDWHEAELDRTHRVKAHIESRQHRATKGGAEEWKRLRGGEQVY